MARTKKPVALAPHMNPALWKALATIVSTDETRRTLTFVHARSARVWEATDGHCAVQIMFDADTELAPGLYDPRVTLARVKANVAPESTNPFVHGDWQFPDIDQVMPKKCEGFAERSDVSFNPALLSRVTEAVDTLLRTISGVGSVGVTVDMSDDVSPALVYGDAAGCHVRAAVMPMRVNEPRKRPQADTFDADAATSRAERAERERDRFAADAGRLSDELALSVQARRELEQRTAYLESVLADLRADVTRLTQLAQDAQDAADTDAADAARALATVDELRAELNTLRHLRPKASEGATVVYRLPQAQA